MKQTKYIPIPDWNKHHPWPTAVGLRNLIYHKDQNNFAKVIKRVGRRILIDEAAFFQWVEEQSSVDSKCVEK